MGQEVYKESAIINVQEMTVNVRGLKLKRVKVRVLKLVNIQNFPSSRCYSVICECLPVCVFLLFHNNTPSSIALQW